MRIRGYINYGIRLWRKAVYLFFSKIEQQNSVVLFASSESDKFGNIAAIAREMERTKKKYFLLDFNVYKNNSIKFYFILAKARVFVVDAATFIRVPFCENTTIIQCWHAGGTYKKVGFDAKVKGKDPEEEEKRIQRLHGSISYFVCSSDKVGRTYTHAFRLKQNAALILGLPRLDSFVRKKEHVAPKEYTILYAPTFRTYGSNTRWLPALPDAQMIKKRFQETVGAPIHLAFRSHPTSPPYTNTEGWEDWSNLEETVALEQTSVLVTDFSSIFFDFIFLNRPIIFYVPDYDEYIKCERELYFSPYDLFPDTICNDEESLLDQIILCKNKIVNYSSIWEKYMGATDGFSSQKIVSFIDTLMMGK